MDDTRHAGPEPADEVASRLGDLLPLKRGLGLAGGWTLDHVDVNDDSCRFVLARGPDERVTLLLGGATSGSSPFPPLAYLPSPVPAREFQEAGVELVRHLVAAAPGGDPFSWISEQPAARSAFDDGWDVSRLPSMVIRLDDTVPGRFDARLADVPAGTDRLMLTAAGPLPGRLLAARMKAVADRGITSVVMRIGSAVATGAFLGTVGRYVADARILVSLIPPRDGSQVGHSGSQWLDLDRKARSLGIRIRLDIPLTRRQLPGLADLELPDHTPGDSTSGGLFPVLHVPQVDRVAETGDVPVGLKELAETLPPGLVRRCGGWLRVRSHVGRPLCLFPEALDRVFTRRTPPDASPAPGCRTGPSCERCLLKTACSGLSDAYVAAFGFRETVPFEFQGIAPVRGGDPASILRGLPWEAWARWLLIDRPEATVRLVDLLPDGLPDIRCTRPWTRLEFHHGGTYGPCCADYMEMPARAPEGASLDSLWTGGVFREFRRALIHEPIPHTCHQSCPVLVGGTDRPGSLRLLGGPAVFVENQICMLQSLIDGRIEPGPLPLAISVDTTDQCNYDCVMCQCGGRKKPTRERDDGFYQSLGPWMQTLASIEVNGGEPLVSAPFRRFAMDGSLPGAWPRISLVTNGSLLSSRWMKGRDRLPFHDITVSLNAATSDTYAAIHRAGVSWDRVRANLDSLRKWRRTGLHGGTLTYSMVILRMNVGEIQAFADLAARDGAQIRFLLPVGNRNDQSIMIDPESMQRALEGLESVLGDLGRRWRLHEARQILPLCKTLRDRLDRGDLRPL